MPRDAGVPDDVGGAPGVPDAALQDAASRAEPDAALPSCNGLVFGSGCCANTNCVSATATASLSGTTPLGAVNFSYVVSGGTGGFSTAYWLQFSATSPPVSYLLSTPTGDIVTPACGHDTLTVSLSRFETEWLPPLGVQPVVIKLHLIDGQVESIKNTASVEGAVIVTSAAMSEPFLVTGTLDLVSPGWNIHGNFSASRCADFFSADK